MACAPALASLGMSKTTCEQGTLDGTDETEGVLQFFDIPYAENAGRFRPAGAPRSFRGARNAKKRGPIFPQPPSPLDFVQGTYAKEHEQSEDAFRINVVTPNLKGRLPVLFWIHGGGFMVGGGGLRMYSGVELARTGRVVVVSMNYRLGVLGNFYMPGVAEGNQAVHDLEMALAWVKRNIERFGGDPDAIVLSGQSAGAFYTQLLMGLETTAKVARGAVILSLPTLSPVTPDEAHENATKFCALAGLTNAARDLPNMTTSEVLATQDKMVATKDLGQVVAIPSYPMRDGTVAADLAEAARRFAPKPLLIGWTREEAAAFFAGDPTMLGVSAETAEKMFKDQLGVAGPTRYHQALQKRARGNPYTASVDLVTETFFKRAITQFVTSYGHAGAPTFAYQLDYPSAVPHLGACHCFDIPFWMNNFEDAKLGPMLEGLDMETAAGLSVRMKSYLLHFIETGNPNGGDLPIWKQSGDGRVEVMHLDELMYCAADDDAQVA